MEGLTPRLFPYTELNDLMDSLGDVIGVSQELANRSEEGKVKLVDIIKEAGKELHDSKEKIIQAGTEEEVDFSKYNWKEIDEHYRAVVEKNEGFFDSYFKGNSELITRIISQKPAT